MARISLISALNLLQEGKVIAIPTDTVYGIAADMHKPNAIRRIFELKGRPNDKPLIILFSQLSQISHMIAEFPKDFDLLVKHFWPGALTLILPIHVDKVDTNIRVGLPTTGFRMPAHPLLLQLLQTSGPVVAPSANMSGHLPAISAEKVEQDFGSYFPVLDGGTCTKGKESTILNFKEGSWHILRQGAIDASEIAKVLGYEPSA